MYNTFADARPPLARQCSETRNAEIIHALRRSGADSYNLLLPETRYLPRLLRVDEQLRGAIYGKYELIQQHHVSRGLLVITDRRMLLIDKKPLFMLFDDISFSVVSGITYSQAGIGVTVTLNTRFGDISFRTFNAKCASTFVKAVEDVLFNTGKEDR